MDIAKPNCIQNHEQISTFSTEFIVTTSRVPNIPSHNFKTESKEAAEIEITNMYEYLSEYLITLGNAPLISDFHESGKRLYSINLLTLSKTQKY